MTMKPTVVWTEIPVSDLNVAMAFYGKVFGYDLSVDQMGPQPTVMLGSPDQMSGHLYEGKPADGKTGPTIHLALPDSLEAGLERCRNAGGTVVSEAIEIPPGRFAYANDPDGNSIGLFELKA